MNKLEIFQTSLATRKDEIMHYQINIDNYRLAIEKIAKEHTGNSDLDLAMQDFSNQLQALLKESIIEQRKAQIIHDVIEKQIEVS